MNEPYQPNRPVPPGYREVQCIYVGKEPQSSQQTSSNQQSEQQKDKTQRAALASRPEKPVIRRAGETNEAFLKRHSRKCQVCHHPDRDAIEGAFIMWRRPKGIAEVYRLRGDSLYRHAVAFDLFSRRRRSLRKVLENIMERGVETEITGETILGAVKAYACLDDNNRWIEPTSNVIFSTNRDAAPTIDVAAGRDPREIERVIAADHLPLATVSNRNSEELKIDVTH